MAARQLAVNYRPISPIGRNKMIAAAQIRWKRMRPDLSGEDSREERLAWITSFLKLRTPLKSMTGLSDRNLQVVLDEMDRLSSQPASQSSSIKRTKAKASAGAQIIHLATEEQVWAIEKIFEHLQWSADSRSKFLFDRFKRRSARHLQPKQAHALIRILLNIAASRYLKEELGYDRVSRSAISASIPELKLRIGLDRSLVPNSEEEGEQCTQ